MIIVYILIASIILTLFIKIYLMKKSLKEISRETKRIINLDTNNLITVSSDDIDITMLVNILNDEIKKLRIQKMQYENGNQELKTSITNISHDMRTPITAINGYIDLIKNTEDAGEQEKYINVIEKKVKELVILTEELFDYSKDMDMGVKIKKERCCINQLLEETLANYYMIFKEKNITPHIDIVSKHIYSEVDRNSIIRVFENILSNVAKYSDGDFKIKLNEEKEIIFSNKAKSLDAVTVKKIFNRYYTVGNTKKSSGIGLAIAKQLVELNGGQITAEYTNMYLIIKVKL